MYSAIPHSFPVHRNTLQQHMKVHTGKDFKCQYEGCIFACRSQAELRNHQQVHSDRRPYHCDTCSYSAKTKPQLLRWSISRLLLLTVAWGILLLTAEWGILLLTVEWWDIASNGGITAIASNGGMEDISSNGCMGGYLFINIFELFI